MARESKTKPKAGRINWRLTFTLLALGALGVSTAVASYKVHLYVTADPQFTLSRDRKDALTIQGLVYASRPKVLRVFAQDFEHSIFSIPLTDRRLRLVKDIDWIQDAIVSRVWPDRLVVRIVERKPVAFVSLRSGSKLIDASGVLLEQPALSQFSFPVLSSVRDDDTEATRRERVRTFLQVEEDLGYLSKEISEIDTADPDNIRFICQVDRHIVTLLMGDENFARRYQNFVAHYPEIRKGSPEAKEFDLRLDDRITVKN
jgi:cell division protein FtsQ